MEEKKLTDEEIVEALGHCATENTCRGCVKYNGEPTIDYFKCMRNTKNSVVDIIHRQKAEIEQLRKELANAHRLKVGEVMTNAELQKQVNELENRFENKTCCNMSENCSVVQQAIKDTAKEILHKMLARTMRLREQFDSNTYVTNREHLIATIEIEIGGIKNLEKCYGVEVE